MHHIKKVRKPMRYDAEHKQKTRERVLQEAAKAIRAEGPHRIGVASVMAKAGLTHGGFYAHFASKEALVVAAIGHMFDEGALRRLRRTEGMPPGQGLAAYIDFYLSAEHRDARLTGCPMAALAADLPRLTLEAQASFAAGVARTTAAIAALLTAVGHADAEDLASSAVAELVGALSLARAEPDKARSDVMLERSKRILKQRLGLEGRS
jgi:TetR/AcrR family transcriptional repressor of nem operon